MSKLKHLGAAIGISTLALAGMGASSAYAAVVTASIAGAHVSGSSYAIFVKDTANDSQFVRGDWKTNQGSTGTVTNKLGVGQQVVKTVSYHPEMIEGVKACRSNTFTPMTCTGWNEHKN